MIKNSVKKLIVFALCAIFVLPFIKLPANNVLASELDKVFLGTEYYISIADNEELSKANKEDVKIEVKTGSTSTIVFDGEAKVVDGYVANFSASEDEVTITFYKNGIHEVTVSKKDGTTPFVKSYDVGNTEEYIELKYDFDETKLNAYKSLVEANVKSDLIAGDSSYVVPELTSLISTNFPYGSIRKTVYYYTVGDTGYKTNTASKADLKISIKNYGSYRFYVLFDIEKSNLNIDGDKSISVSGLKEKVDGFYRCLVDGVEVYFDSSEEKYYELKADNSKESSNEIDVEGKTVTEKLIVPIFEFTLPALKPTIKIASSYQEAGYVDMEYSLSEITIHGDSLYEKYELEYKSDENGEFEVIEELSSSSLKFTPKKIGIYRVKITAFGINDIAVEYTKDIKVSKALTVSKFKVSFQEWFEVNTLPFILLCVSFTCLVAIILLLVIKPKEKEVSVKEEDR